MTLGFINLMERSLSSQLAALLGDAPSFLDDCLQTFCPPQDMKTVLEHHRNLGHFGEKGTAGFSFLQSLITVNSLYYISKRVNMHEQTWV